MRAYLDTRGDKERDTVRHKLYAVLRCHEGDRPLATLTTAVARKLYGDRAAGYPDKIAGATLRGELRYVKQWGAWCVANGWLRVSPFDGVQAVGPDGRPVEVNRGKPKLRVNPSRQFLAFLANDNSLEATAVLTAFMLGLRASEVVKRTVEDLDDDGWLLWIRDTKTEAGDREIEVPELLRVRLLRLAEGKHPTDRIFGDLTRYGLHYHTIRLCAAAGVPRVTPHGLRGSGATRAVRLGGTVEEVAVAIGHADAHRGASTLKRHYLGGGAEESARGRKMETLLPDLGTPRDLAFPSGESEDAN